MTAVDRIKNVLDQHARVSGLDPELIYSVHSNPDAEAGELRASDLRSLVDRIEGALFLAWQYAQVDGAHHKAWAIDQMVRALTGCPEVEKQVPDSESGTYTYKALGESDEYLAFIAKHNAGEDGPETYSWDEGIAP